MVLAMLVLLAMSTGCAVSGGLIGAGVGMAMDHHHPERGALIGAGVGMAIGLEADRQRGYAPAPVCAPAQVVYVEPAPIYVAPRPQIIVVPQPHRVYSPIRVYPRYNDHRYRSSHDYRRSHDRDNRHDKRSSSRCR